MRPTPVAIVTGFLGSGKTTLLAHVLDAPDMARTAVIINEFGEVSIDHLLVRRSAENIVELRNGCLCCNIRGDLVMTLRDLHEKRILGEIADFDYVVIETTGLADPVPILHTLMANPPIRKAFTPDVVITCADVLNVERTVANHQTAASQIAMADIVLVTKTDLSRGDGISRAQSLVRRLNPGAEAVLSERGQIDAARLFRRGLFEAGRDGAKVQSWMPPQAAKQPAHRHDCHDSHCSHPDHHHDHHHGHSHGHQDEPRQDHHDHGGHHDHAADYASLVLQTDRPLSLAGAAVFLNRVVNLYRDDVLRIKGVLHITGREGQPAVVHAVQDKFYPIEWLSTWPDQDRTSRIVMIGRNLPRAQLEEAFSELALV